MAFTSTSPFGKMKKLVVLAVFLCLMAQFTTAYPRAKTNKGNRKGKGKKIHANLMSTGFEIDLETLKLHRVNDEIGHGVFAASRIDKDVYLAGYKGEIISPEEGKRRAKNNVGAYVFFFHDRHGKSHYIDALLSDIISKFVNDSPKEYANAEIRVLEGKKGEPPMLGLYSTRVINKGEEVRFTYNKEVSDWWWRKPEIGEG